MTVERRGLLKGKVTLNCVPDPRWPAPVRHESCDGWVNPMNEATYCECPCHEDGRNPRKRHQEALERARTARL